MHKIIMGVGGIVAALGALFIAMIIVTSRNQQTPSSILVIVAIGGGLILSGAVLYSFGAIVEHLVAIRANTEKQLEIFSRLGPKS